MEPPSCTGNERRAITQFEFLLSAPKLVILSLVSNSQKLSFTSWVPPASRPILPLHRTTSEFQAVDFVLGDGVGLGRNQSLD